MTRVEPLSSADVVELTALASRDDVVRFGDHLPTDPKEAWAAWIGPPDPDRAVTLAAREGDALIAAAKLTLPIRRRCHHVAQLALVASCDDGDAAVAALLDAAIDTCDRWLHVDRLELRAPADHRRVGGLFRERGFDLETRRRDAVRTGDAFADEVGLARLVDRGPRAPAASTREPWPRATAAERRREVTLRPVRAGDGPAMAAMMGEPAVVWGTMQTPHQRPERWGDRAKENDPTQTVFLAAEVDGALVANGALMLERTLRRRHAASVGMAVSTAWRGRGVGRALLEALLRAADDRALARVELTVYPDNEPAVRLYESLGFEHEGRHRLAAFRDGIYVDQLAMARLPR